MGPKETARCLLEIEGEGTEGTGGRGGRAVPLGARGRGHDTVAPEVRAEWTAQARYLRIVGDWVDLVPPIYWGHENDVVPAYDRGRGDGAVSGGGGRRDGAVAQTLLCL